MTPTDCKAGPSALAPPNKSEAYKQRTGSQLKTWIDSAPNRLGAKEQLTKTKTAEGYPEEVRTFMDGEKALESWFYWSKGKSITFLEGQVFSQATFPPAR